MPKKKNAESPEEQFKRFQRAIKDMEDAGELNPTEADERFERAVEKILPPQDKVN